MKRMLALGGLSVAWGGAAHAGWQDGYLSITNVRHEAVRVLIDQRSFGELQPGEAEAYRLPAGRHAVQILDSRGRTIERETVTIAAYSAKAMILDTPAASLDITNHAGAQLQVWVDGEAACHLAPGQSMDLSVLPGVHEVKATYRQHDQRRELLAASYRVQPGEVEHIRFLPPTTSLVQVVNTHPIPARVQINGQWAGTVGAGQTTYIEAPVGSARIAIVGERGKVFEEARLSLSPFEDASIRTRTAQVGALTIHNPLPIPVRITSDGSERTLQPYESASWPRVRAGSRDVHAYRLTGEHLGDMSVVVRAGGSTRADIAPPREGIAILTNRSPHTASIYLDGRLLQTIPGNTTARISAPVGTHQLSVTAGGRQRHSETVRIDRYEESLVTFGQGRGSGRGHGHGHDDHSSRGDDDRGRGEVSIRW